MTQTRKRALIIGLIVLGILFAGLFGYRSLLSFSKFRGQPPGPPLAVEPDQAIETDVDLIRDWMTVPYIAKTYGVSPGFLFEALGIPPRGNEEKSLAQLNEEFSPKSPGIVLEVVRIAIQAGQSIPTGETPKPRLPLPTTP